MNKNTREYIDIGRYQVTFYYYSKAFRISIGERMPDSLSGMVLNKKTIAFPVNRFSSSKGLEIKAKYFNSDYINQLIKTL